MPPVENPTIQWPVRLSGREIAAVPSDSLQAVSESVARIGTLELGQVAAAPFLGLPAIEFIRRADNLEDQVRQALEAQEPDAAVTVLQVPDPGAGWEQLRVEVDLADKDTDVG